MQERKQTNTEKTLLRKQKYSSGVCIKWLLSRMWKWDKSLFLSSFFLLPVTVIVYALGIYMPAIIIEKIDSHIEFKNIVLVILALLLTELMFKLISEFLSLLRWNAEHRSARRFYFEMEKMDAQKDYFLGLDEEYAVVWKRASQILGDGAEGSPGKYMIRFFDMMANALCFVLFGTIISSLHPIVLLFLVIGSLLTLLPKRYEQNQEYEERDERNANAQKLGYLSWRLPNILRAAKDIRIYNFIPFLEDRIHEVIDNHVRLLRRQQKHRNPSIYTSFAVGFLRDGLAYLYLIKRVTDGNLTLAEFVLYFSAIAQLSGFIDGIIQYLGTIREAVLGISDCISFFDEPHNILNQGEGIPIPKGRPLCIEFRNVTYKYPKGERNILENISFCIQAGEKISLVGLNGAGKTTLTKLMCGLLMPDEGEVLIDGHTIMEYNRDEFYTLFSILPQEYTILPTTIAENVAFCERGKIDEKKLWNCLEKAGIDKKVRTLPKGIDTEMDRRYVVDAVDFSGGEMQKILLARALYHETSIIILDEPTAALDPIAEDYMYQKYRDMTMGQTSIFISHRLASTRFCDRIYLLEGAHIVEEGSHKELMNLGGRYRELFDIQSKYYREGESLGADEGH